MQKGGAVEGAQGGAHKFTYTQKLFGQQTTERREHKQMLSHISGVLSVARSWPVLHDHGPSTLLAPRMFVPSSTPWCVKGYTRTPTGLL